MSEQINHIKYPKTGQFRDAIKQVQSAADYHGVPTPTVKFKGTVKLHGTNAAIVIKQDGTWYCQSRERVITPESDNAGFAAWVYGNAAYWNDIASIVAKDMFPVKADTEDTFQIYGEWCGQGVQSGVGVSKLPKMFVIFAIRISKDAESTSWRIPKAVQHMIFKDKPLDRLFFIEDFPTFSVDIDFNTPTAVQNTLVEITEAVEKDCPVARHSLPDCTEELVGEGVVWSVDLNTGLDYSKVNPALFSTLVGVKFKVKGEKHSVSKVKTIAPVDVEKVKSINDFVEYACTENRLKQGLEYLKEMQLPLERSSTGEFIKWVVKDILKEELVVMQASGIEPRDINGALSKKAQQFFFNII